MNVSNTKFHSGVWKAFKTMKGTGSSTLTPTPTLPKKKLQTGKGSFRWGYLFSLPRSPRRAIFPKHPTPIAPHSKPQKPSHWRIGDKVWGLHSSSFCSPGIALIACRGQLCSLSCRIRSDPERKMSSFQHCQWL